MRYLSEALNEFSQKKLVFITGPRQVGKTTMALEWLQDRGGRELHFDVAEGREEILTRSFLKPTPPSALLFDEIHKYRLWKNYIKGLYDREGSILSCSRRSLRALPRPIQIGHTLG